jgi:hypothetical protein
VSRWSARDIPLELVSRVPIAESDDDAISRKDSAGQAGSILDRDVFANFDHLGDDQLANPGTVDMRDQLDHGIQRNQAGRQAEAETVRFKRSNIGFPSWLQSTVARCRRPQGYHDTTALTEIDVTVSSTR